MSESDDTKGPRHSVDVLLLHLLITHMGQHQAVVVTRATLAKLLYCTAAEIETAVAALVDDQRIQRIQLSDGTEAYAVGQRVAWDETPNDQADVQAFSARVIVDRAEQTAEALADTPLRPVPSMFKGE